VRRVLATLLTRIESRALLVWIAAAGAAWGFLNIADEVSEGETAAIDRHLLLMLRRPGDPSDPIGPRWVEEFLRDVTALGGFTVLTLLTVVAVLVFAFHRKYRQAAILAGVSILAQISSQLLKGFYDRPRPLLVPHGSFVYSQSFPSGHSTLAAATYLTLATLIASLEPQRSTKILVYCVAAVVVLAVGFSRIYLGVHWPSDVLAGWCLGAGWAFVGWLALDRARAGKSLRGD